MLVAGVEGPAASAVEATGGQRRVGAHRGREDESPQLGVRSERPANDDPVKAAASFERSLAIHPYSPAAQKALAGIRKQPD